VTGIPAPLAASFVRRTPSTAIAGMRAPAEANTAASDGHSNDDRGIDDDPVLS
jgi:hypothetical protein